MSTEIFLANGILLWIERDDYGNRDWCVKKDVTAAAAATKLVNSSNSTARVHSTIKCMCSIKIKNIELSSSLPFTTTTTIDITKICVYQLTGEEEKNQHAFAKPMKIG